MLAEAVAGELIRSEIEIRSGRGESFADAVVNSGTPARACSPWPPSRDALLATTGTHPWSPWQDQQIIDTAHYHRVEDLLQYVAWRNNTFSVHVHVGVQGAERAVAVCDRLRPVMPDLLALSANSPFLDGRHSGLHSARTQIFTKSFPRCGIPDAFGSWRAYADYIDFLEGTNSIEELTQVWWSVRPHHSYGTVEMRICDAQTSGADSTAVAGADCGLHRPGGVRLGRGSAFRRSARAADRGELMAGHPLRARRQADRSRAARGVSGGGGAGAPARLDRPGAGQLGIDPALPEENGAQRQSAPWPRGASIEEVYAAEVAETQRTYAAEEVSVSNRGAPRAAARGAARRSTTSSPDGGLAGEPGRHPADRAGAQGPGQAKEAIDAARALLPLCPEDAVAPLKRTPSRRCRCST